MIWTTALPYFPETELACKGSGVIRIDRRFTAIVLYLRLLWDGPLSPTSFCRSPAHNAAEGGHPNSLHLTENPRHPTAGTMAADFAWRRWATHRQLAFARLAWSLGLAVGLHDGFCHVDFRTAIGLSQQVFLYGTWSGAFAPDAVINQTKL